MQERFLSKTQCVLELSPQREVVSGSREALAAALDRGADLMIATGFFHDEHLSPGAENKELVEEVSDFRVVFRVGKDWSAGIMNLRMPGRGILGFADANQPSWSFFMYNCDGTQAIARPHLNRDLVLVPPTGESPFEQPSDMPKYHILSNFDAQTNAPSQNFIYDFEYFKYIVRDDWTEIFAHDENGNVLSGSLDALVEATRAGRDLKAAIRNFDHQPGEEDYEIFTYLGSTYYSTKSNHLAVNSQPLVLVKPAIPMRYASGNWRPGNMLLHTDGTVEFWTYDPYFMKYSQCRDKCAIRYFTR